MAASAPTSNVAFWDQEDNSSVMFEHFDAKEYEEQRRQVNAEKGKLLEEIEKRWAEEAQNNSWMSFASIADVAGVSGIRVFGQGFPF